MHLWGEKNLGRSRSLRILIFEPRKYTTYVPSKRVSDFIFAQKLRPCHPKTRKVRGSLVFSFWLSKNSIWICPNSTRIMFLAFLPALSLFCPVDRYTRTIPAAQPLVAWQNLRKFPVPYGHNNDLFLSLRLPPSSSSPKAGLSKVSANCLIRVDQVTPHNLVTHFPSQRLSWYGRVVAFILLAILMGNSSAPGVKTPGAKPAQCLKNTKKRDFAQKWLRAAKNPLYI